MDAPHFVTARLTLSEPVAADVADIVAAANHPDILQLLGREVYTAEDAAQYVQAAATGWESGVRHIWAIRVDGTFVGQVSLDRKGAVTSAVIGYWLSPAHGGHGYLVEAATPALAWALNSEGGDLRRIIWHAYEWNTRSAHIARKLGFEERGVHERHAFGWNHRGRALLAHLDRKA